MQQLEERKKREAKEQDAKKAAKAKREGRELPKERPELRKYPKGKPKPKDQQNFTDADSRLMCMGPGHFEQCYNAQLAVDDEAQIIVATGVEQCAADNEYLIPMLEKTAKLAGNAPRRVLADAGYRSEDNLLELDERGIDGYVALGREGKQPLRGDSPATKAMQRKLATKRGRQRYRKRKYVVEPVFGWIKAALGFRSFSLRGLANVRAEWDLVCSAINLRRLAARVEWS